ncbi:hypothetical protein D3C85_1260740 [compost metagenome]
MDIDVAVFDTDVGATAGEQDLILRGNLDGPGGGRNAHAVPGGELDAIVLGLDFDIALGRKQFGARGLGEQADTFSHAGQQ